MPARRSTDERLEELISKKDRLDAQIETLDARRRAKTKKDEDRIKWLLGTLVFDRLSDEPALQSIVRRDLPDLLTDRDRARGLWESLFPEDTEKK